jgi:peptidoglycan hydrolase-like protein with peptidoglycan-binding domain
MSDPCTVRARRSRVRRSSAAVLLASGLTFGTVAVAVPSGLVSAAPAVEVIGLQRGAVGESVKALQQALNRAGIGVKYGVDGYFGSATQASVKAFQNYKHLPVTGVVDAATAAALGFAAPAAPAPAPSAVPAPAASTLALGSMGPAVSQLQQQLINAGQSVGGGIDGVYGVMTADAVKRFQQAKGLPATGKADAATLQALQGAGQTAAPTAGALAQGARGAKVRELQQALLRSGISVTGGADGIFGAGTVAAVKAFQQAKGISPTGVVDAATASALALTGAAPAPAAPAAPQPAAGTAANATGVIGLQLGSRGPAVAQIQRAIISMGWPIAGGADGVFGNATRAALLAVQRANGVAVSGMVDEATARMFGLADAASAATPQVAAATSAATAPGFAVYDEHGRRVVALQQALIAQGIVLRGGADGVFGSSTLTGILTVQRAKGLPATGKLDAATGAALGLGAMDAPAAQAATNVALEAKPVQGPCYYGDTWHAARSSGRVHLGVDIVAKEGNELYAVATGTISKIYTVENDPLTGNGVRVARPDGTYFFYGHMSAFAPGLAVGTPVTAGQVIGYVGHTGNAGVSHLHLEVHPGGGSAVNPYPIVKAFGAC